MPHFTPHHRAPREECLNFIRAFARLYSPESDNEQEARLLAKAIAYNTMPEC